MGLFDIMFWDLCAISVFTQIYSHGEDVNLNKILFGSCHRYSIGSSMMYINSFVVSWSMRRICMRGCEATGPAAGVLLLS